MTNLVDSILGDAIKLDVSLLNDLSTRDVDVYIECDMCCGLFPQPIINQHATLAHDHDGKLRRFVQRRLFAVTLLPESSCKLEPSSVSDSEHDVLFNSCVEPTVPEFDDVSDEGSDFKAKESKRRFVKRKTRLKEMRKRKLEPNSADGIKRRRSRRNHASSDVVIPKVKLAAIPAKLKADPNTNTTLTLDSFPEVPRCYETVLLSVEPSTSTEPDSVHTLLMSSKIGDKSAIHDWMGQLMQKTDNKWLSTTSKANRNKTTKHYSQFHCRYSDSPAVLSCVSLDAKCFNCKANASFSVREHECIIRYYRIHSHDLGINDPTYCSKGVYHEVSEQFNSYFDAGMIPYRALKHHMKRVQERADFKPSMLKDPNMMPSLCKVMTLYSQYKRSKENTNTSTYDPQLEDEDRLMGTADVSRPSINQTKKSQANKDTDFEQALEVKRQEWAERRRQWTENRMRMKSVRGHKLAHSVVNGIPDSIFRSSHSLEPKLEPVDDDEISQ